MLLFSAYVAFFALSGSLCVVVDTDGTCLKGHVLQLPVALVAACLGGCGLGLMWTCQGALFARTADELAKAESAPREQTTLKLSSMFALILLGTESTTRLASSLLMTGHAATVTLSYAQMLAVFAGLAFLATCTFQCLANSLEVRTTSGRGDGCCGR
eukprot:1076746-Amphidinium_carterae.1